MSSEKQQLTAERWTLLRQLNELTDRPLMYLSFV